MGFLPKVDFSRWEVAGARIWHGEEGALLGRRELRLNAITNRGTLRLNGVDGR